jgi:hypothetical protein
MQTKPPFSFFLSRQQNSSWRYLSRLKYNNFPGTQPIPGHCGIYLVSPSALLRAPTPPRPLLGEGSTKKTKKKEEKKKAKSAPGDIRCA